MGEWSEYFEDFPEENPANQRGNVLYGQLTKEELAIENAKIDELNAEVERQEKERADFIEDAKSKPIYKLENCPICRIKAMNIYKVTDDLFYCECEECYVSGDGSDVIKIFAEIENKIWTNEL